MLKLKPKYFTIFFITVFIIQMILLLVMLFLPKESQAVDFIPQVGIDQEFQKGESVSAGQEVEITKDGKKIKVIRSDLLPKYIRSIYGYAVGVVGILAAVVLMFGGVLWLTAGGNAERVTNAKSWIGASLTGLVLVLCSYLILSTINLGLVSFKPIEVEIASKIITGCCLYKENETQKAADMTKTNCDKKDKISFDENKFASGGTKCITEEERPVCCVINYQTGIIFTTKHCICYQNITKTECSTECTTRRADGIPFDAEYVKCNPDSQNDGSCSFYTQPGLNCTLKN